MLNKLSAIVLAAVFCFSYAGAIPPIDFDYDTFDVYGVVENAGTQAPVSDAQVLVVLSTISVVPLADSNNIVPIAGYADTAYSDSNGDFSARIIVISNRYLEKTTAPIIPTMEKLSYVVTKTGYLPASDTGITALRNTNLGTIELTSISNSISINQSIRPTLFPAQTYIAVYSLNGKLLGKHSALSKAGVDAGSKVIMPAIYKGNEITEKKIILK